MAFLPCLCVFRRIRSLGPGFSDAGSRRPRSGRRGGLIPRLVTSFWGIWLVVCHFVTGWCNFRCLFDYRTPVHFVPGRPLIPGVTAVTDAPHGVRGRLVLPALVVPGGRRRLSAQGRAWRVHVPGSLAVRGCPAVTAGLDAEGRPRILARRVPRPGRGSVVKVSGGEAASFWSWAAQRPFMTGPAVVPQSWSWLAARPGERGAWTRRTARSARRCAGSCPGRRRRWWDRRSRRATWRRAAGW